MANFQAYSLVSQTRSIALCTAVAAVTLLSATSALAGEYETAFSEPGGWEPYFDGEGWALADGQYRYEGDARYAGRLAPVAPVADVVVEAVFQVGDTDRRNVGVLLRARDEHSCIAVRYYDRCDCLEIIPYTGGQHGGIVRHDAKLDMQSGAWYHVKAAAVDDAVVAKVWQEGDAEPDWQAALWDADTTAGGVGVHIHDGAHAAFRMFRAVWGGELAPIPATVDAMRQARIERLHKRLRLEVEVTPFVHRHPVTPRREVRIRTVSEEGVHPVSGRLDFTLGDDSDWWKVEAAEFFGDAFKLFLPEPAAATPLTMTYETALGRKLTWEGELAPARPWTFYMTPHTHYDIGYTEPQPEVIERLTEDMRSAARFCEATADWPEDSRFRWTVEVTGLMKRFIERYDPEVVAGFMDLVRAGVIEVCGFYLNMPTELVGHEELVRCLYDAEALRREYGIPIDTIMIDDVPGYTWALPELLAGAGMPRATLRANNIRGQFLWDRKGAVPRPFYWAAPSGATTFVWYTDSYREGNFFREPGLHTETFYGIIKRNEAAGAASDLIQLRMGGDNLPPDIEASENARDWNEKFVWPRVRVATNRMFLDDLEARHGEEAPTLSGDIPSWWAEGPASSAAETARARLLGDELVAVEGLAALGWLVSTGTDYPGETLARAWDHLLHFDEHTWGAHNSISNPRAPEVKDQWAWKKARIEKAEAQTAEAEAWALEQFQSRLPAAREHSVAVWNPLAWPRTDVVHVDLAGTTLEEAPGIVAVSRESGKSTPVQRAMDGSMACFIAHDVPSLGYRVYDFRKHPTGSMSEQRTQAFIENERYHVKVNSATGQWTGWLDKKQRRELLDSQAELHGNQPVRAVPEGGRDTINRKQPVTFEHTPATAGELVRSVHGPVFEAIETRTRLPGCPEIRQEIRLYDNLDRVEITNIVEKEPVTDPEGIYFAFPFNVASPQFRLQLPLADMRPGDDQLPYTCQDFYSVQQWADVRGESGGVIFVPLDAPVLSLSDWNVYRWADDITFDKGHVYSLAMNNYWHTNFKADQSGTITFRYALATHDGAATSMDATRMSWPLFYPLRALWLDAGDEPADAWPRSVLQIEGGHVLLVALKRARAGDGLVVRLLETNGEPAACTLQFNLPGGRRVARAYKADVLENRGETVPVAEDAVSVQLDPNELFTLHIVPGPPVQGRKEP